MFSPQQRNGWPQIVWAVTDRGQPLEAQREGDAIYHGYPMPILFGRWCWNGGRLNDARYVYRVEVAPSFSGNA